MSLWSQLACRCLRALGRRFPAAPCRIPEAAATQRDTRLIAVHGNPFSTLQKATELRLNLCQVLQPLMPSLIPRPGVGSLLLQPQQQSRSVTKWSIKKGKRKSVKAVTKRFFRLGWGAWIRPIVGRSKKRWSRVAKRNHRAEHHVFCNATQSTMLDKMVTSFWRRRRHYVDDIYEPYHQREEFSKTAVKPH